MAVNATDGSIVFKIDGAFRQPRWAGQAGIADGIITLFNTYDNQIYSIGKGPSKTTVTADPKVSAFGDSILIEGTVTDISAGTQADNIALRFANGVPAVSDDSMSQYMKYVYMQFPAPNNATGVPVTLSILDSNGNFRTIGTTTSDAGGAFSFLWQPDIPGACTVYATFLGTNSYWPSSAQTAVGVTEAASSTVTPIQTTTSMVEAYFLPAVAAIILAIVLVGAVLFLTLRKRP
jgi:hypothetical protein